MPVGIRKTLWKLRIGAESQLGAQSGGHSGIRRWNILEGRKYLQGWNSQRIQDSSTYRARTRFVARSEMDYISERTRLECIPIPASCDVNAIIRFTSGCGAVLAMDNDAISSIDPTCFLQYLLDEDKLQNCVKFSEVHRTSSYARYLSSPTSSKTVTIGFGVDPCKQFSRPKWIKAAIENTIHYSNL